MKSLTERLWHKLCRLDGRWLTAFLLLCYFGVLVIAPQITGFPAQRCWTLLGVPAEKSRFGDLNNLILGGESFRAGIDLSKPMMKDPNNPIFNYPDIWLYADRIGLNPHTLPEFGIGLALAFFAAAFFVAGELRLREGIWLSLFLVSPAVMLGVERGNIDLFIFCLLAVAVAFRRWAPVSLLFLVIAALLKIFPIFSLSAYLRQPYRRNVGWAAVAAAVLFVGFALMHDQIHRIATTTPSSTSQAYGAASLLLSVQKHRLHMLYPPLTGMVQLMADIPFVVVVLAAITLRPKEIVSARSIGERERFMFQMGAGIYLCTFALGTHFDYRLIFLVLCMPLLIKMQVEKGTLGNWAFGILLVIVLYAGWDFFSDEGSRGHVLIKQLLSWGIAAGLAAILSALVIPVFGVFSAFRKSVH